jgi:osmotically-inducible protein OsmY
MSMDIICDVVEMVVAHDDFRTSEEATKRLDDTCLLCNVEAALSANNKIWSSGQQVSVSAHDGRIELRGSVRSKDLRDLITETASKVDGVVECQSELTLRSDALR